MEIFIQFNTITNLYRGECKTQNEMKLHLMQPENFDRTNSLSLNILNILSLQQFYLSNRIMYSLAI